MRRIGSAAMSVLTVSGIVTRFTNYKENDRILTILTPGSGRIDCKARGCRKPTSPLLPCAESFVYGDFELYASGGKNVLNACTVRESFFPIRQDIVRFAAGTSMLQLCAETAQENEECEALFLLLYHALSFLSYGKADPKDLFCCFLIRFLDLAGFRPSITSCAGCGKDVRGEKRLSFSSERGGTLCSDCSDGHGKVTVLTLEAMRRMLVMPLEDMDRVKLPGELGSDVLRLLCDYTCHMLECGPKALSFLLNLA